MMEQNEIDLLLAEIREQCKKAKKAVTEGDDKTVVRSVILASSLTRTIRSLLDEGEL